MFRAFVLDRTDGALTGSVRELDEAQLPEGDVIVRIAYSSLNYKDGLAVTGRGKIVRGEYPFVPGIDFVGTVEASEAPAYAPGDLVVGTGWGLGETHWGGYSQLQRVRSEWLVPLPEGLTPHQAMTIGTAGFTAMLSVMALEEHGADPTGGEIVVTGASGGVGSMAVAILSTLGFPVVASTGSADAGGYLRRLGAARVIDRAELAGGATRPLDSARWAGAVDNVGGTTLAAIISQLDRHGSVASVGLAGGSDLSTTVFPFILRGVNLLGIDSNTCPTARRRAAWARLAAQLPKEMLEVMTERVIPLAQLPETSEAVLRGEIRGRVVVDVNT